MALVLTPGERNEKAALPELMRRGAVKRPGPGRPKLRPRTVVGDKGYTGRPVRDHLRRHGIGAVIPQLRTEKTPRLMDRELYRERNVVEVVLTQMTKAHLLAARAERDDVADLDLTVGDQHPVDQQGGHNERAVCPSVIDGSALDGPVALEALQRYYRMMVCAPLNW
jgi:transposase